VKSQSLFVFLCLFSLSSVCDLEKYESRFLALSAKIPEQEKGKFDKVLSSLRETLPQELKRNPQYAYKSDKYFREMCESSLRELEGDWQKEGAASNYLAAIYRLKRFAERR